MGEATKYTSLEIVAKARELLIRTKSELKIRKSNATTALLERRMKLEKGRLTQLLSASQGAKEIDENELLEICKLAFDTAAKSKDVHFGEYVDEAAEELVDLLVGQAGAKILSQLGSGIAVYKALGLDAGPQDHFSKTYAGNYLLFRRDAKEQVIVSFLHISASKRRTGPGTFETIRQGGGADRKAVGIIYQHDRHIYALGLTNGTSSIRVTILRPYEKLDSHDLIGMRLGVSSLDDSAPFAHPLYCRRVEIKATAGIKLTGRYPSATTAAAALDGHCPVSRILAALERSVTAGEDDGLKSESEIPPKAWRTGLGIHKDV